MHINKLSLLVLLLTCNIFFLSAQEDSKYLAGAVPLVDDKVVFTREIPVDPSVSKSKLLEMAEEWAKKEFEVKDEKYPDSKQRILLVNNDKDYLVVQGDERHVFKSMILMIDQTFITYQLIVDVEPGLCKMTMRNIKYEYQDYDYLVPAEEMITDKYALNKNKDGLNRHYSKFRKFTIDKVDELENSLKNYIMGGKSLSPDKESNGQTVIPAVKLQPAMPAKTNDNVTVTSPSAFGYKQMKIEDLTNDIVEMFKDNWALVSTEVSGSRLVMPALWTGKGNMGGKAVAMSLVKTDGKDADTYTISFYTGIHKKNLKNIETGTKPEFTPITLPSGEQAFAEAWMIIECKKVLDQPATENMQKDAQSKEWGVKNFDKLLMGEIVNVWVR